MRIGIDFGTTRIVVAAADRGNYPLVNFDAPDGRVHDWYPAVLAVSGERRVYGWEALQRHGQAGWTLVRSLKRGLKSAGPYTQVGVDGQQLNLGQLVTEMLMALRRDLLESSTLGATNTDKLQVMLGVPANANSNQRFMTEEAARAAGFEVLGLSNEPSAAAIEFAYRDSERKTRSRSGLLVYDLGGGTFDASLVQLGETEHTVIETDGIPHFGGDDFDEILAEMALEAAGLGQSNDAKLSAAERFLLLEECREKKESLNPNSRKVTVDLERVRNDWKEVSLPIDGFYERCRPLIENSRVVVEALLAAYPEMPIDTLYLTGGGSELPQVARILRETFGRRVRRSAYMRSATAIGLAIRADAHHGSALRDQFTHNFGVWREADQGHNVVFDVIFPRGIPLPRRGDHPLRMVRTYHPAHNIGHFRYLECTHLDGAQQPQGEIANWDEIRVAFDPELLDVPDLSARPVQRSHSAANAMVQEEYTCDANGNVKVRISNLAANTASEYRLGNWSRNGRKEKTAVKGSGV